MKKKYVLYRITEGMLVNHLTDEYSGLLTFSKASGDNKIKNKLNFTYFFYLLL